MKYLVIDDELVSRGKAQLLLSKHGHCDAAASGVEGYEMFIKAHESGAPYDAITLDIQMPDMDGMEVLKKIRKWEEGKKLIMNDGVKIIMLTAKKTSKHVLSSFRHGCEAFIIKPFDEEKLCEALKSLSL